MDIAQQLEALRRENAELRDQNQMLLAENRQLGFELAHGHAQITERMGFVIDRLQRMVEACNLALIDWINPDQDEIFLSERVYRKLGYEPDGFAAKWSVLVALADEEDQQRLTLMMQQAFDEEGHFFEQLRFRRPNGRFTLVELSGQVTTDPITGIQRFTGAFRDVTAREEALLEVTRINEMLRLVVYASHAGIWDWPDIDRDELIFDDTMLDLLGYKADELTYTIQAFWNMVHPEDIEPTHRIFENCVKTNSPFEAEYRIRFKNTGWRWVRSVGILSKDETRTGTRLTGAITDIHDRHMAEIRLAEANAHLERFAYIVAHDLAAPLRHIQSFSSVIDEDYGAVLPEEGRLYLRTIEQSADRMHRMITDLLQYARTGTAALSLKHIPLQQVISELREMFEVDYDQVQWQIDEDLPALYGDDTLLRLLWQNLLSNAIKFSRHRPNPSISIQKGEELDELVEIRVKDNGIGFDQAHAQRMFEAFERVHNQPDIEGFGIGLANVARIVSRHGGKITAEGRPNEGAQFRVWLPKSPEIHR